MCVSDKVEMDSALAVKRAREALGGGGPGSVVVSFRTIDHFGFILSLYPAVVQPGGGGLVWVDRQTGCTILLVPYE
jgi:hypothetical protein